MTDPRSPEELEAAELRGRLRGRWKAERRAEEYEALHDYWCQRDLVDALRDAMSRKAEVALTLPGPRELTGHIITVARDYVTLQVKSTDQEYVVRLFSPGGSEAAFPLVNIMDALSGQIASDDVSNHPPSFQAVLQQFDFRQQTDPLRRIEVGTQFHPTGLSGRLLAHAGDHLYLCDRRDREVLIPTAAVTYVTWATHDD